MLPHMSEGHHGTGRARLHVPTRESAPRSPRRALFRALFLNLFPEVVRPMSTQNKNLIVLNNGQLEKAAATDTIQVYSLSVDAGANITGDTVITGDLEVTGTIVSKGTENVIVRDAFLDLAFGNTTNTASAGGFTVSHNRASGFTLESVTDFTAGSAPATPPTFTVSGGSTALVAGDIVAITGASDVNNDGLYVVASVASGVVTIKGLGGSSPSGAVPFVQTQFTAGTGQSASAYKVDISSAAFADGTASFKDPSGASWAKGTFVTAYAANAAEGDFTGNGDWDSAAQTSLQEAYVIGNTITTSAAEGDVVITGDQKLDISATGGVAIANALDLNGSMDADVTSYDVNASGAYSVLAGAASSIATSAGDLTLDAQAASLILDGGEAAADAVRIVASNANGGIDIDAGTAGIALDSTGAISLGAAAASDFTVAGNLTMETTGAGITDLKSAAEVQVSTLLFDVNASGAVQIDAAAASNFTVDGAALTLSTTTSGNIVLAAAGDVDADAVDMFFDATGGISIDSVTASNFTVGTGDLTLKATAASVILEGGEAAADAVWIKASNAAGGIDIDAGSGGITMDTSGALSLDSTGTAANLTLTANSAGNAAMVIAATNTGAGVANIDIDADGALTIDADSFSVDATAASNLSVTGGNLTVSTVTSGVLAVTAAGNLDMDAGGTITLDSSGGSISIGSNADAYGINIGTGAAARTITVGNTSGATALDVNLGTGGMTVDTQSGGAISLDAVGAASNFTVDGGSLTLSTTTSGSLVLASAAAVDMDAATGVTVDAGAGISLDAASASNFTVTGAGESLTLAAAGGGAQQLVLNSAGTGADALRLNASAGGLDIDAASGGIAVDTTGVLSLDAGDTTNLTMSANAASAKFLTVEANNADAAGTAQVLVKAKNIIQLGDAATYASAFIQANHFLVFGSSGGLAGEAGEVLAIGDAVVAKWDAVNSKVRYYKAANNAASDMERNVHGIVQSIASSAGSVFKLGTVPGTMMSTALAGASADVGKPVFLGTGGALTTTPPTTAGTSVFRVGFVASDAGKVLFQPQFIAKIL